jgi:CelD/BcsL family acetyltransferase involved in cellulose biosynthesis
MGPVQIEIVTSPEGFEGLGAGWNNLLASSSTDSVFLSWEWLSTWWAVYGAAFLLHVLLARGPDGDLLGAAPLMIGPGPGRFGGFVRHLSFIGQHSDTVSEQLDFVVRRGREAEVVPAFCRRLLGEDRNAWDVFQVERARADSATLSLARESFATAGLSTEEVRVRTSPFAALPDSWEAFLDAKTAHFRKKHRYAATQLEREGPVEEVDASALGWGPAMEALRSLNRERWGEQGDSFRSAAYNEFHGAFSRKMADRNGLLFFFLRQGGRLISARYDFVHAGKVWHFQGGWRPELEKKSIGMLTVGRAIRRAIALGCHEFDFLGGAGEYKRRWGTGERTLLDLEFENPTARGRVIAALRRWRRRLRRTPSEDPAREEKARS